MKLAIRTLAALLALSSTAMAEDWRSVQTSPPRADAPNLATGFQPVYDGGAILGGESVFATCTLSTMNAAPSMCDASNIGRMIPLTEFARSSTVMNLTTAVNSVSTGLADLSIDLSALQVSTSAANTALSGQVSGLGARVSAVEGSLGFLVTTIELNNVANRVTTLEASASTFATTAGLNGVASRVTAIEGSLGSFASVGSLNGVAARVATIEANMSSFATTSNLNALSSRVADAESQLAAIQNSVSDLAAFVPEALGDIRRQADEGSAMAAAMSTVAPADGKANRIGFNTATYNGSTAVAVSYSRAAGDVDFNVGVAMAGDNAMVKAGAGFSW